MAISMCLVRFQMLYDLEKLGHLNNDEFLDFVEAAAILSGASGTSCIFIPIFSTQNQLTFELQ